MKSIVKVSPAQALAIVALILLPLAQAAAANAPTGTAMQPPAGPMSGPPLDLHVPGPDFAKAARQQASTFGDSPGHPLISLPAEEHGFNVHGGLEAGVMAGSHGTSGQYTAGHVNLSRGNYSISLGVSEYGYHGGRNWGRW